MLDVEGGQRIGVVDTGGFGEGWGDDGGAWCGSIYFLKVCIN